MPKRTVKFKSFVWHRKGEDYNGDDVTTVVQSKQGEEIDIPTAVAAYGDNLGAFVTAEDEADAEAEVVDVTAMDHEELVDWVSESTIPEIMAVAKANPDLAPTLLEAENAATGDDPRNGLADGLAAIIGEDEGSAQSSDDSTDGEDEAEVVEPEEEETVGAAADRLGVDLSKVEGSGDDDEVTLDDVKDYYDEELADATDSAVELADESDVYLADIAPGTGKEGRIGKGDVEKYLKDLKESESA